MLFTIIIMLRGDVDCMGLVVGLKFAIQLMCQLDMGSLTMCANVQVCNPSTAWIFII